VSLKLRSSTFQLQQGKSLIQCVCTEYIMQGVKERGGKVTGTILKAES
jgi:hypothetical protein